MRNTYRVVVIAYFHKQRKQKKIRFCQYIIAKKFCNKWWYSTWLRNCPEWTEQNVSNDFLSDPFGVEKMWDNHDPGWRPSVLPWAIMWHPFRMQSLSYF